LSVPPVSPDFGRTTGGEKHRVVHGGGAPAVDVGDGDGDGATPVGSVKYDGAVVES
jgi:hypothetical protein